jgi:hypothetical protein
MTNRIKGFFGKKKRSDAPHSKPAEPPMMVSMDQFMFAEMRDMIEGYSGNLLEDSGCETIEEFIHESCDWEGGLNVPSMLVGQVLSVETREAVSDIRINTFQRYKIDPMQLQMLNMDPDFIEFCERYEGDIRSSHLNLMLQALNKATDVIVWRMFKPCPEAEESATLVYCCAAEQIQRRRDTLGTIVTFGSLQSIVTMPEQFVLLLKTGVLQADGLFFEQE